MWFKLSSVYKLTRFVLRRVILWLFTMWVGLTVTFIVSRASPVDPGSQLISRLLGYGATLRPEEIELFREQLLALYGLNKPLWLQYFDFLRSAFTFNFGPSFAFFPVSVNEIIANSILWTLILLTSATIISWILGVVLGTLVAFLENRGFARVLEGISIGLYPLPYTVLALVLFILFAGVIPIYRGVGGSLEAPSLSSYFILSAFNRAWLPALSLIILSVAGWLLSTQALAKNVKQEGYVKYAVMRAVPLKIILGRYIFKNVALPQITALALQLGYVFTGALVTEYIFSYPGLGRLLSLAISNADYNLMLGILTYSIVGIATAALILDLIYPLIDPRIRYGGE